MKHLVLNWKMSPSSLSEARRLLQETEKLDREGLNIVVCPPFPYLLLDSNLSLGAQDVFGEKEGAYTGEVSIGMLKDIGCQYILLGHSERSESEEKIRKKLELVLDSGMTPILFVGDGGVGEEDDHLVTERAGRLVSGLDVGDVIFVYEPIWAISTGKGVVPSREQAERGRGLIRRVDEEALVLYGGSVDSKTVNRYLKFDGVAVGGASLDTEELSRIVDKL